MQEKGIISKIDRTDYAIVRLSRKTACENCRMCMIPKKEMYVELKIKNTEQYKKGDFVLVTMGDSAVLSASFIVYFLPLVIMAIALYFTYQLKLWICLAASMGSVILSFLGVILIDRFFLRKRKGFFPEVIRAIDVSDAESNSLKALITDNGKDATFEDEFGSYKLDETIYKEDDPTKISKK